MQYEFPSICSDHLASHFPIHWSENSPCSCFAIEKLFNLIILFFSTRVPVLQFLRLRLRVVLRLCFHLVSLVDLHIIQLVYVLRRISHHIEYIFEFCKCISNCVSFVSLATDNFVFFILVGFCSRLSATATATVKDTKVTTKSRINQICMSFYIW